MCDLTHRIGEKDRAMQGLAKKPDDTVDDDAGIQSFININTKDTFFLIRMFVPNGGRMQASIFV